MPMDIGINARVFGVRTPDGAAQVGIRHAQNLINRQEIDCMLYGHQSCSQWFDEGVRLQNKAFRWNSQVYGIGWERTALPVLAANDDLDILFCPNANAPPINGRSYRTVLMIHHVGSQHGHSPIQRAYRKSMIPLGVMQADAVVTVSDFSKEIIIERLPIDERDVHTIYNGVNHIFFEENAGQPINVPEDYILFVGSADERKNLKRLLSAYEAMDSDIELVVAGPQDSIAYGRESINRDGITNLGYVSQAELRYIYEQATLFAYPSLYEGFGLPPVEAAACGTPVVTSNVSAIPEVMGDAAEYVDPYDVDSIRQGLEIIHDSDRLAELSERGRKRAQKYTWKKATDRLLNVFNEVV